MTIRNKTVTFLGNLAGVLIHLFYGCTPFYKFEFTKKSKLKKRVCRRCLRRWDMTNGKWKFMGRYRKN